MPIIVVADRASVPDGVLSAEPDRESIADAVAAVPAGNDILLVSSSVHGWHASRAVRLAFGQERIGLLRHDAPPTAVFVLAASLSMLPEDRLSLGAATASLTSSVISTHVLMSSVTALDKPTPRFSQHVRSLFPGGRFLVDWGLQHVSSAQDLPPLEGVAAIVARSSKPFSGVDETGWPSEQVELPVPTPPWRAARWLEVTTLHERLDDVATSVLHPETVRALASCVSCARPGWGERCLFCQLPLTDPSPALVS